MTLSVSKQWFDMIADGRKDEEYREIKPYWVARLLQNNSNIVDVRHLALALAGRTDLLKKYIDAQRIVLKQYTHVLFINGYRKDSPRIEKEIESITMVSRRKVFAQASGWIMNFSSSSSSDMDKTTELSYNHLISQLRKENADLRNEVRELRKLLTKKGDKPPN